MASKRKRQLGDLPPPRAYNPLERVHLAESVAYELLEQPPQPLGAIQPFLGAGVYAIYFVGTTCDLYSKFGHANRTTAGIDCRYPLYVGKAVPKGARKGGYGLTSDSQTALLDRLIEHQESVHAGAGLDLSDFYCRYLVVEDIFIPLGESMLIERFQPPWNLFLDGFGNHDPGAGRSKQQRSPWDVVHPGRAWAAKLAENKKPAAMIVNLLTQGINGLQLTQDRRGPRVLHSPKYLLPQEALPLLAADTAD